MEEVGGEMWRLRRSFNENMRADEVMEDMFWEEITAVEGYWKWLREVNGLYKLI